MTNVEAKKRKKEAFVNGCASLTLKSIVTILMFSFLQDLQGKLTQNIEIKEKQNKENHHKIMISTSHKKTNNATESLY